MNAKDGPVKPTRGQPLKAGVNGCAALPDSSHQATQTIHAAGLAFGSPDPVRELFTLVLAGLVGCVRERNKQKQWLLLRGRRLDQRALRGVSHPTRRERQI